MGLNQLIRIVLECRKILISLQKSQRNQQIIKQIDNQLTYYNVSYPQTIRKYSIHHNDVKDVHHNDVKNVNHYQSQKNVNHYQNQKKLFQIQNAASIQLTHSIQLRRVDSTQYLVFNQQQTNDNTFKKTSNIKQKEPLQLSLQLSKSNVKPFKNNYQPHTLKKVQQTIKPIYKSGLNFDYSQKIISNNSFQLAIDSAQSSNSLNFAKIITHNVKQSKIQNVQIQDFFIIDYNFDQNQYQILPKKQNYYDKCTILNDPKLNSSQFIQNSNNRQGRQQLSIQMLLPPDSTVLGQSMLVQPSQSNCCLSSVISSISSIYQTRQVMFDLILSKISDHLHEIKVTPSMTDLLTRTTNLSKFYHLIIPSFLEQRTNICDQNITNRFNNRYTHVFNTKETIKVRNAFFQYQRFFVIIQKRNKPTTMEKIVKGLTRKLHEIKVGKEHQDNDKAELNHKQIKQLVKQLSLIPKNKLHKFQKFLQQGPTKNHNPSLFSSELSLYSQGCTHIKFCISTQYQQKSFPLLTILIYFIIFEYKIIFLTTKDHENIISQVIMAITHMIGEFRYIYPVILGSMTNHHIQFTNLPVPGLIGLWGKQSRHKKTVQYMKDKFHQQNLQNMYLNQNQSKSQYNQLNTLPTNSLSSNSLSTLCVDMYKHQFISHQFTIQQMYFIENLNKYIGTRKQNVIQVMNQFFNSFLINQKSGKIDDWIERLGKRAKQTQMYEEYIKFKHSNHPI